VRSDSSNRMLAKDKDRARTGSTNLNGWSSDRLGASHESEGKWENGGMRTIKCGPNRYLSSSAAVFPRLFLLHQFGRETTKNADGNTKSKNRRILRTKTNETSKTLDTLLSSVQTIRRTILRLCIFDLLSLDAGTSQLLTWAFGQSIITISSNTRPCRPCPLLCVSNGGSGYRVVLVTRAI